MKNWLSFTHLKVRTSLLLVLAFFILALIGGAALGILSLKQNNAALQQIVQHQRAANALNSVLDHYKDSQSLLGRAVASYTQNVGRHDYTTVSTWVEDGAGVAQEMHGNTRHLLEQARQHVTQSSTLFKQFEQLGGQAQELGSMLRRIISGYQRLLEQGVEPLFTHLQAGKMEAFNAHLTSRTRSLEEDLYNEVMQFNLLQQEIVAGYAQREAAQYALVTRLVSVAMLIAGVISLLVYLFLNKMVLSPLRRMETHFSHIAQGNLTEHIDTQSTNEIGVLFKGLQHMQLALQRMVSTVREGVNHIQTHASDIHDGTLDLSARSEQQAAALQQTASSMNQLASIVRQNTDNAMQADQVAQKSALLVRRSGDSVASVVKTMEGISSSADKISDIVNVIDSIAFQTNILALNAAVEAARAGEQGRGFAVVAGEVRSLAQRSAQAAQEIKELITQSLEQVQKGADQAQQTGKLMDQVVQSVTGVTTLMSEISQASNEQSTGIEQVNRAVTEMDATVHRNAQLVYQATTATHALQEQAERLAQLVAIFRINDQSAYLEGSSQEIASDQNHAQVEHTYLTER
ncbi:MAG: HAMP domain-containing protein [Alcaligenaceae bacterium]|nr:HAMP domain-containing protein [Alcaligenaceae bacterium]